MYSAFGSVSRSYAVIEQVVVSGKTTTSSLAVQLYLVFASSASLPVQAASLYTVVP